MKNLLIIVALLVSVLGYSQPSYLPSDSLRIWLPFTGNALDSSINNNNGIVKGATLTTDRYGNQNAAYLFSGSDYIEIPHHSSINFNTNENYSISCWAKVSSNHGAGAILTKWTSSGNPYPYTLGIDNIQKYVATGRYIGGFPQDSTRTHGKIHYMSITYSKFIHLAVVFKQDSMYMYVDGRLVDSSKNYMTSTSVSNTTNLYIGQTPSPNNNRFFNGIIDDIAIWGKPLSSCEIKKIYHSTTNLITSSPHDTTASLNSAVSFSISDTGGLGVYKWQVDTGAGFVDLVNGAQYSGTNSKSLSVNSVLSQYDGNKYRCIRIDSVGCYDTSNEATLSVCPLITQQPISATVNLGSNAIYVVNASGANLSYQWQSDIGFGFQNISNAGQYSGVNNDTLVVSNTTANNNLQLFRCIVTNGSSCVDTSVSVSLFITTVNVNSIQTINTEVYPNPVNDMLSIQSVEKNNTVTIYNTMGEKVKSKQWYGHQVKVDVSDLSSGLYFVKLNNQSILVVKQ